MAYGCQSSAVPAVSLLLVLVVVGGECDAGRLITTQQVLPSACLEWFTQRQQDCPIKADWDPHSWDNRWGVLNETCCSNLNGTVLHCVRNGTSNFPACLPDQKVPAGHAGRLVRDKEGNPQFEVVPCNSSLAYQSEDRVSSSVTFPYCLGHRSVCHKEKGQQLLCRGGPTADDWCTCSPGYKPNSPHCVGIFTNDGDCWCQELSCAAGYTAVAIPTPTPTRLCASLTNGSLTTHFGCLKDSSVTTLPPTPTGSDTDRFQPSKRGNTSSSDSPGGPSIADTTEADTTLRVAHVYMVIVPQSMFLLLLGSMVVLANCRSDRVTDW